MNTPDRDTIAEGIKQDAIDGVQSVTVDGRTVQTMSLKERMEYVDWVERRTASSKDHLGMTFRQFEPGGTG